MRMAGARARGKLTGVNPSRWSQINELFHAALERDPATRDAFLRSAAAGDAELLREVQSLLATHRKSGEFLDQPAWGIAADLILDEPAAASLVGKRIGSYHVIAEVGRGGMGVVYAAEDERLGRTVALKALTPEYTRDATRRERLVREARAAAGLSHPAIATIFALEEIDGNVYITSELVRGRTLRDDLRDGPLPPAQLQPVLVAIAEALAAAHQRGIVHRDLKPENIIRRDDGQIKVLDFGIARSLVAASRTSTQLTQDGMALGTPGYMAPEQFTGEEVDARADQFAFGVLAWELATGEHPFGTDAASVVARMTELMEGKTAGLSRALPLPGLDRIVRRCMRATPAERYASTDMLLADVRALDAASGTAHHFASGDALWWWQFHQVAIAIINALMPVAMWTIRKWVGRPYGSTLFLVTLTLATVSVTLRLNLFFTSRVHPGMLIEQRNRSFSAIAFADAALAVLLLAAAGLIAGDHDEISALFLSVAVVVLASLGMIEPATTRAAGLKA
jgi:hypothetical protein